MKAVTGSLSIMMALGLACTVFAQNEAAPKTATTQDNLQTAYQEESNAKARYEAFAVKADAEGFKGVASMFRAMAKSESIRAGKRVEALKKLGVEAKAVTLEKVEAKTTKENIEAAIKEETEEKDTMYPAFAKQAEADKNEGAIISFKGASTIYAEHIKLLEDALKNLDAWKPEKKFYVCQVCSLVMADNALGKCPICAAPRTKFVVVK